MGKQKKVKTGFSISQEAHDALREMADGPRGYGDFVGSLILAEKDKRQATNVLTALTNMGKRLDSIDRRLRSVEAHLHQTSTKPTQSL